MGNGVSGDQGNLPAHGKRDVREGLGAKRHDWSELARTREIVTPPPNPTSYNKLFHPNFVHVYGHYIHCTLRGFDSERI